MEELPFVAGTREEKPIKAKVMPEIADPRIELASSATAGKMQHMGQFVPNQKLRDIQQRRVKKT